MVTLYYCNVLCYDDDDDDDDDDADSNNNTLYFYSTGAISTNKPIALNKPTYTQLYKP